MQPLPLRRIINSAKNLMKNQGMKRRRAIIAAIAIVARNVELGIAPKVSGRADSAETEHRTERFFHSRHAAPAGR